MNGILRAIPPILLGLWLAGCGGAPPVPPPATATIGPAGGTVAGPSGAAVVIPANALAQDTPIGVAQSSAGAPALPSGAAAFGPTFAFTPHGTSFAVPATVTVPFDPARVPAGTTPRLYKTNAAATAWEEVAGATVGGSAMTGQVSGFSHFAVANLLPPIVRGNPTRKWQFFAFLGNGKKVEVTKEREQTGGEVDDIHPYTGGTGNVHSTADGATYWAHAIGLTGSTSDPGSQIGNLVKFKQTQRFTKGTPDARLKFTITRVVLDALSFQASDIFPYDCVGSPDCNLHLYSFVAFELAAYTDDGGWRSYHSGSAEVSDSGLTPPQPTPCKREWTRTYKRWETGRYADKARPAWSPSDFSEVSSPSNCRFTAELKRPIPVELDLSTVKLGESFTVEVDVVASTFNEVQGESKLSSYFRDPVNPIGSTMDYTGLIPIGGPLLPPPVEDLEAPPCTTGVDPAAGVVQFSAPSYFQKEVPFARRPVTVTRTGGSKGELSVRLSSGNGTALAGQDYEAVDRVVYFAHGDGEPRTVEVPMLVDSAPESDEAVNLRLSGLRGCGALGIQSTATLNILDNDRLRLSSTFSLGGTVSGLAGSGLVLEDRARALDLAVAGNGPFTFTAPYPTNTPYDVRVRTQPTNPIQTCTVANGKGTVTSANVTNIAVSCATAPSQGGLDPSFGAGGKASMPFGATEAMALQTDGKIVMVGSGGDFLVARLNPDGSPDASFGSGGKVTTAFPGTLGTLDDKAHAVAIQADGKIVVAGEAVSGRASSGLFNLDFALARYNADGSLDASFGTGGLVTTGFGDTDRARGVAVQPDGKIVAVGDTSSSRPTGGTGDFLVARYNPDGSLDASFGGGLVTTDVAGALDAAREVALQPDGKIVVAGDLTMG